MSTKLRMMFKRSLVFLHDLTVIPIAWYLAYWLRFNLDTIPTVQLAYATKLLPFIMILQLACYGLFGLYRGIWRFASIPDLFRIFKAVALAVLFAALILFFYNRLFSIPRSILLIYPVLMIMFLGGARFIYRWVRDYSGVGFSGDRVLIIGSGKEAEALARNFRHETKSYKVIGFVDDKEASMGQEIQGIRILGQVEEFDKLLDKYVFNLVVIAAPNARPENLQKILKLCDEHKIQYRILPTLSQITSGQVSISELRELSLEDLLGREAVQLDWDKISDNISGKIVLVTGGGGSIGSELCRQIARLGPAALVIIDNSEYNLYSIEIELSHNYPSLSLKTYLSDVTDYASIEYIFKTIKPHIVLHAAAYKHVPLLEYHIDAAVHNNIVGSHTVAKLSLEYDVDQFILISTDKAVNPTNVMGASKRIAEIICQDFARANKTKFITVRFGNVLGSRGSVIPLFKKQLERGGPITVTHPEIERFFMTIPEASQLILQAAVLGMGGEIFVLDMGQPIKIRYLAEQLIRLAGKIPGKDIEIVYTGLRPGEKLYEELFHDQEASQHTQHKKIFQSFARQIDHGQLKLIYDELVEHCFTNQQDKLKSLLKDLVPEYSNGKNEI